jgi:hypothetical protein
MPTMEELFALTFPLLAFASLVEDEDETDDGCMHYTDLATRNWYTFDAEEQEWTVEYYQ